jgi:(1->4)-alpha-D-glucan 1-alpha-D-glucosylmutase
MAKAERPDLDADLFDFLANVLILRVRGKRENELVARFQQTSGPVMAKGVEDTAFYCYNRFVGLNEVGGHPGRFGLSLEEFHAEFRGRCEHTPRSLLTTSTHDTKRSDDVRARLAVLSEVPDAWREAVWRWTRMNERHKAGNVPDRNLEYLYYQTLVGAFPLESERARAYMHKAAKEAKVETAWTRVDAGYESALERFVERTLADQEFTEDLATFVAPLIPAGRMNSLAQTLLKLVLPGVPDLYQGSELWDLSLVDPDNRRPVDFERRRRLLRELDGLDAARVVERMDEGLPKLWLIQRALRLRRERPRAFTASYEPILAKGQRRDHVIAFARGDQVIAVAPRFPVGLAGNWSDTTVVLPEGRFHDRLSGTQVEGGMQSLAGLLARFPAALLAREAV